MPTLPESHVCSHCGKPMAVGDRSRGMHRACYAFLYRHGRLLPRMGRRIVNHEEIARRYWVMVLDGFTGTVPEAAQRLGVHERTLYRAKRKFPEPILEEVDW